MLQGNTDPSASPQSLFHDNDRLNADYVLDNYSLRHQPKSSQLVTIPNPAALILNQTPTEKCQMLSVFSWQ